MLVLDASGVSRLAVRSTRAAALMKTLRREGLWPPVVPSAVLIASPTGHPARDANANRLLKTCDIADVLPDRLARRAALLRTRARQGSAVDALVVASAEPGGTVLTSDPRDIRALATHADDVGVERV